MHAALETAVTGFQCAHYPMTLVRHNFKPVELSLSFVSHLLSFLNLRPARPVVFTQCCPARRCARSICSNALTSDINYKSCVFFLLKYYKSSPRKIRMQVDKKKNHMEKHKEGIRIPYR